VVRSVADRAFLPTKSLLEEVGDMMILGKTIVSALRPPYPFGGEFVSQFLFALKLCWFPLLAIVLVGCYYGYHASGGPVGVGTATAKSMVLNIVLVHLIGMLGTQLFWGANPRAPIGG